MDIIIMYPKTSIYKHDARSYIFCLQYMYMYHRIYISMRDILPLSDIILLAFKETLVFL